MTKTTGKTARPADQAFAFPPISPDMIGGGLFSACARVNQVLLDNATAFNTEIMRFASKRLDADAAFLRRLPECTSWERAVDAHTNFARKASEDYSAEIPKLMEHGAKCCATAMEQALEPVTADDESTG